MSTIKAKLYGIRNMSGGFAKMMKAKLFCDENGLSYPKEVREYFANLVGETEEYIRSEMQQEILVEIDAEHYAPIKHDESLVDVTVGKWGGENSEAWVEFSTGSIPREYSRIRVSLYIS